ncbi:hypothetical protein ACFWZ3_02645 [Frateuria sp. GZRR35]|uniref:hypothetical protein n=1 Tax=unclassified Frateuria TaxID=2648894 RepID=UPI003EDB8A31
MNNTIQLLETIGGNAALRYASSAQVMEALENAHASPALRNAVSSGNEASLLEDFGQKAMQAVQLIPQVVQMMWRGDGFLAE